MPKPIPKKPKRPKHKSHITRGKIINYIMQAELPVQILRDILENRDDLIDYTFSANEEDIAKIKTQLAHANMALHKAYQIAMKSAEGGDDG